jgi:hypothetical protein
VRPGGGGGKRVRLSSLSALIMVSATSITHVPGGSISLTEDMGVEGLRPFFCVAESGRRDDRSQKEG